MQSTFSIIIS